MPPAVVTTTSTCSKSSDNNTGIRGCPHCAHCHPHPHSPTPTFTHTRTHAHTFTHTCTHAPIRTHIYTHTHTCTHAPFCAERGSGWCPEHQQRSCWRCIPGRSWCAPSCAPPCHVVRWDQTHQWARPRATTTSCWRRHESRCTHGCVREMCTRMFARMCLGDDQENTHTPSFLAYHATHFLDSLAKVCCLKPCGQKRVQELVVVHALVEIVPCNIRLRQN